jgi:hypothetical protein
MPPPHNKLGKIFRVRVLGQEEGAVFHPATQGPSSSVIISCDSHGALVVKIPAPRRRKELEKNAWEV